MTTPPTPPRRLALLALDLTGGDDEAVVALLTRLAQLTRYGVAPGGVAVGDVRHLLVPDLTADDYLAAMASLKSTDG